MISKQQKIQETKAYWDYKKQIFTQFYQTNQNKSPENFKNFLDKNNVSKKIAGIIQSIEENKIEKTIEPDNIILIKNQWNDFLLLQYNQMIQSYDILTSENKDDALYFYDENMFFNFLSKIRPEKNYFDDNRIIQIRFNNINLEQIENKYNFFETNLGDKEFKIQKFLEKKGFENEISIFAREELPVGLRSELYIKYFHIKKNKKIINNIEKKPNFNKIFQLVIESDSNEIFNNDRYFVFRDLILRLCLLFFKDQSLNQKFSVIPCQNGINIGEKNINLVNFLPCKHFTRYMAPFCFLSENPDIIYGLFRTFYSNYFCYLHSITIEKNGIIFLCWLFETLMMEKEKTMYEYMKMLNIRPLQITFPWIFYCFIGFFEIEEILCLFDRIISSKNLDILPILCVGILKIRRNKFFTCKKPQEVYSIFSDLSNLKVSEILLKYYDK